MSFRITLYAFILLFSFKMKGQDIDIINRNKDSLRLWADDTNKVKKYNDIAFEISYLTLDTGLLYADTGIVLAKKLNFPYGLCRLYNTKASIFMDKGDQTLALSFYKQALEIAEKHGFIKDVCVIYGNIAISYSYLHDYKSAISFNNMGLKIAIKNNYKKSTALMYINQGSYYHEFGNSDSALHYYELADRVPKQSDAAKADLAINMASIYIEKKDFKKAEGILLEARKNSLEQHLDYYLANIDIALGLLYLKSKNYEKSEEYYLSAEKFGNISTNVSVIRKVLTGLAKVYEETGQFEKAYIKLKTSKALEDSILNNETSKTAKEFEAKYQNEKKQREIENLTLKDEKHKQFKILVAIAGVIALIALVIFVYAFISKRKANSKLQQLNNEVSHQQSELLETYKSITDSIHYAYRIQNALLTSETYIKKHVPDFFVLYKPKDIVSGDFYWAYNKGSDFYFQTADCTGHGVPGAFMSLMGINFLNEIVVEGNITKPNEILNRLRSDISNSLSNEEEESSQNINDGMDCVLCKFNFNNLKLDYAAANNRICIVREGELQTLQTDKMPVGRSPHQEKSFTDYSFDLKKGDMVYTYTDGFPDQFGGPKGKKFKEKKLNSLLLEISKLPLSEQKKKLDLELCEWMGELEQLDDILVVGIKIA